MLSTKTDKKDKDASEMVLTEKLKIMLDKCGKLWYYIYC